MQLFSSRVLVWFEQHGRTHLPWQQEVSAYKTWISEIMLQQTQVATVIPYFNKFILRFSDVVTLANAEQDDVLAHWAGLGYYSRARNLHKSAQIIRDSHNGVFPDKLDDATALSGIGPSTAGAILSLAYGQRHAILDGNVKRVLSRHQCIDGIPNQSGTLKKQWEVAKKFTPVNNCDKYTQAMMDLGALICTRTKPKCEECPVHADCGAYHNDSIVDYPNKKPKKTLPEKRTTMLIVTDGEQLHLEKRPNSGIWGGLWSLPEVDILSGEAAFDRITVDVEKQVVGFLDNHLEQKSSPLSLQILEEYTHTFTHYRLFITPLVIRVDNLKGGFSKKSIEKIGLPTPVKNILLSNTILAL